MTQDIQIYPGPEQSLAFGAEEINAILLMIERIRPEEIVHPEQLMRVGSYSFAQIRVAIAQRALSCVDPIDTGTFLRIYRAQKQLIQGNTARLYASYPTSGPGKLPKTVKLEISSSHSFILEFEFPILEPKDSWESVAIRFADFRQQPHCITFLYDMQKGATLQQIQHMWSGLRFLCRNLREWDQQGITFPEDI